MFICLLQYFFFDFGLSQLTSLQFILYHEAEFYTPTIPKSTLPFAGLQHMKQCKSFFTNFVPSFDPIKWCLKNGLHSRGSNSQPFRYESYTLTTRPRLLAKIRFQSTLIFLFAFHFFPFQSVYKLHYGNNETLVTVSYCNDYDDKLGFAFTIYQASFVYKWCKFCLPLWSSFGQ